MKPRAMVHVLWLCLGCATGVEPSDDPSGSSDQADESGKPGAAKLPVTTSIGPLAPGEVHDIVVSATGSLAVRFHQSSGMASPLLTYILALRPPEMTFESFPSFEPLVAADELPPGDYIVGLDNRSQVAVSGTLTVTGGTGADLCPEGSSATCSGDELRVCAPNLEDGKLLYRAFDCARRGGCDSARHSCGSSLIQMCVGDQFIEWTGSELWVIDCATRGMTCSPDTAQCR